MDTVYHELKRLTLGQHFAIYLPVHIPKIDRILVVDVLHTEQGSVGAWLIARGWKEIVPERGDRFHFSGPLHEGFLRVLSEQRGRFDVVLTCAPHLVSALFASLGESVPVVGVSTTFQDRASSYPIRRGDNLDTVHVTAAGYTNLRAAVLVRDMYGQEAIPHLISRVQQMCRE
jgi:hypothetical protein